MEIIIFSNAISGRKTHKYLSNIYEYIALKYFHSLAMQWLVVETCRFWIRKSENMFDGRKFTRRIYWQYIETPCRDLCQNPTRKKNLRHTAKSFLNHILNLTRFGLQLHFSGWIGSKRISDWRAKSREKCNYNSKLVWYNKIWGIFLCVIHSTLLKRSPLKLVGETLP